MPNHDEYIHHKAYYQAYKRRADKKPVRDRYRLKLKANTLLHYGGKCACCGEEHHQFLTIDHINGGGNAHRKMLKVRGGYGMYSWLKRNGMPHGFQVLCFNCNMAKGHFGECPHASILPSNPEWGSFT